MIKVCFSVEAGKHMQTSLANMWPLWILLLQGEATRPIPGARQKNQKKQFGKTERTGYHIFPLTSSQAVRQGVWLVVPFRFQLLYCSAQLQLPSFWLIAFCPKVDWRGVSPKHMKINMSRDCTPKWTNKTTLLRCGSSMLLSLLHIHFLCQSFLERCCKGCLIHLSLKPFGRLHQGEYQWWLKGLPNL